MKSNSGFSLQASFLKRLSCGTGRDDRLRLDLEQRAGGGPLPQQGEIAPQRHLLLKERGWIRDGLLGKRLKCCHDRARVDHLIAVVGLQPLGVAPHQLVAALGDVSQGIDCLGAQRGRLTLHAPCPRLEILAVRVLLPMSGFAGLFMGVSFPAALVRRAVVRRGAMGAAPTGRTARFFVNLWPHDLRCLDLDQRTRLAGSAVGRPSSPRYHRPALRDESVAHQDWKKLIQINSCSSAATSCCHLV